MTFLIMLLVLLATPEIHVLAAVDNTSNLKQLKLSLLKCQINILTGALAGCNTTGHSAVNKRGVSIEGQLLVAKHSLSILNEEVMNCNIFQGRPLEHVLITQRHIRHYTWNDQQAKNAGLLKKFVFKKLSANTALKIDCTANLRVLGSNVCNRWYNTFNGNECGNPGSIASYQYTGTSNNQHHTKTFEGACYKLPAGDIEIALHVGNCNAGRATGDADTGWPRSQSKLFVEELMFTK